MNEPASSSSGNETLVRSGAGPSATAFGLHEQRCADAREVRKTRSAERAHHFQLRQVELRELSRRLVAGEPEPAVGTLQSAEIDIGVAAARDGQTAKHLSELHQGEVLERGLGQPEVAADVDEVRHVDFPQAGIGEIDLVADPRQRGERDGFERRDGRDGELFAHRGHRRQRDVRRPGRHDAQLVARELELWHRDVLERSLSGDEQRPDRDEIWQIRVLEREGAELELSRDLDQA